MKCLRCSQDVEKALMKRGTHLKGRRFEKKRAVDLDEISCKGFENTWRLKDLALDQNLNEVGSLKLLR